MVDFAGRQVDFLDIVDIWNPPFSFRLGMTVIGERVGPADLAVGAGGFAMARNRLFKPVTVKSGIGRWPSSDHHLSSNAARRCISSC